MRKHALQYHFDVRKRWKLFEDNNNNNKNERTVREYNAKFQCILSIYFPQVFQSVNKRKPLTEISNAHENLIRIKAFINVYAYSIANCFKLKKKILHATTK